jgi:ADP-ribosyl-[dinitrogen reductase] hydrolase
MLVEMAVADAYGAGFEFTQPGFMATRHTMDSYVRHPKHAGVKPGQYTDDTQMALALAELMLRKKAPEWTAGDVADAFCTTFQRNPRDGYAPGFRDVLRKCVSESLGTSFLNLIRPHSEKNGGAMRAGPIGLYQDTDKVLNLAMFQASLTHATRTAMDMAAASALMVHYFHYRHGKKAGLPGFLEHWVGNYSWGTYLSGPVGTRAIHAVRAAVAAILESDTLSEVLKRCVDYGGDTDTTAAIAVCAASRCDEIVQFLPSGLYEGLESGSYGRDYLARVDERLMGAFPPPAPEVRYAEDYDVVGELFMDIEGR